jgi:YD repeat-containing protein
MPAFFPEGDTPLAGDPSNKSLQKINSLLQAIDTNTSGGGSLTDAQLRASPVPVDIGGSGSITITSGTVTVSNEVEVTNSTGNPIPISGTVSNKIAGWDIPIHDYRALGYTSGNLTSVTYKTGGAGGTTVATLTLAYDGSGNLVSMTKS